MTSGLQEFLGSWLQRTSFSAQSRDALALATVPEGRALLRNRIAILDVEIPVLEDALKALLEERKWAQERLDAYAYPVLTLPNEVVSDIFLQYIPPYPERPTLLGDASPTNLLQICRRWREIALSTPALWRAFQPGLGFWRQGGHALAAELEAAQIWLSRSCSLPLSIRTRHGDGTFLGIDQGVRIGEFLSAVVPHRSRWEHASLDLACGPSLGSDTHMIDGDMLNLRQLHVVLHPEKTWCPVMCSVAPKLRTVFLETRADIGSYDRLVQLLSVPWGQLTRLFLNSVRPSLAVDILTRTPGLVECQINIEECDDDGEAQTAVLASKSLRALRLARLETLILGFRTAAMGYPPQDTFLNILRLPFLRKLLMDEDFLAAGPDGVSRTEAVKALVKILDCPLESLRLCVVHSTTTLEVYRAAFPDSEIPHLEVHGWDAPWDSSIWGEWKV
uniref:F-box domain-containing protein n=1 Tax=Mycena chlorophos TaxID=658473 RepID=A0ABQ0M7L0_MYCCL|nr:predicted protein [Mycena chlorophos]